MKKLKSLGVNILCLIGLTGTVYNIVVGNALALVPFFLLLIITLLLKANEYLTKQES